MNDDRHVPSDFLASGRLASALRELGVDPIGSTIGTYHITALLGVGGMGEVYRARDTRLGRDVAIKILPRLFTSDPDRLARFEREARMLASLNHPNVGAIYGLEDADAARALVLELVEGETLADRIARGPIPVADSLTIARQIADALDAAHEKGIIHRDLKPSNIKITPDGIVKVLDFGLAKAVAGDAANPDLTRTPTTSVGGTREGVILGTAAYMSPEQARGQTVDKRTDIWAFGCVMYEMLTGRPAFARDTLTDTLAAIVEREPEWALLPPTTSPRIVELLHRCLDKDPKRRLRDIGDAYTQLESDPDSSRSAARRPRPFGAVIGIAALATIAGFAAFGAITILRARTALPPWATDDLTLSVELPTSVTIQPSPPAVSPDGRQIAWAAVLPDGRFKIWTEALTTGVPRELPGTEGGNNPFWSPDGRSIGFLAQGQLKRIEVATGAISTIAVLPDVSSGATWSAENIVVFAARYGIFAVAASGGTPTKVAALNRERQENQLLAPQFLPDNRHFLYVARSGRPQQSGAYVGSLDGKSVRLFSTSSSVKYAPPGYLLSMRGGALMAQPFNPTTFVVGSEGTTIVQNIAAQGGFNGRFDVSPTGLVAFFAQPTTTVQVLRWFDRAGNSLSDLTETGVYSNFRIGPDGHRVAVDRAGDPTGGRSVWVYEGDGRPPTRVTFGGIDEWHPLWSPDGEKLAFMSYRDGPGDIYIKSMATTAPEEPLITDEEQKVPSDWSADGRFLAYWIDRIDTRNDVWVLPVAPKGTPIPIARTPFAEQRPRFSTDGRFIAYESDETGQLEVYVQPFPPTGRKWQVSVNGGTEPKWRDQELWFRDRDRMLTVVPVTTRGSNFSAGRPVRLFKVPAPSIFTAFEISPDGQRILMRMATFPAHQPIMVVLNWMARLKK